jgi:hypothetical protein
VECPAWDRSDATVVKVGFAGGAGLTGIPSEVRVLGHSPATFAGVRLACLVICSRSWARSIGFEV